LRCRRQGRADSSRASLRAETRIGPRPARLDREVVHSTATSAGLERDPSAAKEPGLPGRTGAGQTAGTICATQLLDPSRPPAGKGGWEAMCPLQRAKGPSPLVAVWNARSGSVSQTRQEFTRTRTCQNRSNPTCPARIARGIAALVWPCAARLIIVGLFDLNT